MTQPVEMYVLLTLQTGLAINQLRQPFQPLTCSQQLSFCLILTDQPGSRLVIPFIPQL